MFDLYTPSAIEDAVRQMREQRGIQSVVLDHETESEKSYLVTRTDGITFALPFRKAPLSPDEDPGE